MRVKGRLKRGQLTKGKKGDGQKGIPVGSVKGETYKRKFAVATETELKKAEVNENRRQDNERDGSMQMNVHEVAGVRRYRRRQKSAIWLFNKRNINLNFTSQLILI